MSGTKENALLIMQQKMEALMRENEELRKRQYVPPELTFKITDRGAIEISGLSKYKPTLFADQIIRLLEKGDDLKQFIEENKDKLSWRNRPMAGPNKE